LRADLEIAYDETEEPLTPDSHIDAGAPVSPYVLQLAQELAQQWGSLGGTYRAKGDYVQSIDAYDAGYMLQINSVYGHDDSYNLVQRLIARILSDPSAWAEGKQVAGVNVDQAMIAAKSEVERQLAGPRKGDEWALADRAILCTLMGSAEHAVVWADLNKRATQAYVVTATLNMLKDVSSRLAAQPAKSPKLDHLLARINTAEQTLSRLQPG